MGCATSKEPHKDRSQDRVQVLAESGLTVAGPAACLSMGSMFVAPGRAPLHLCVMSQLWQR